MMEGIAKAEPEQEHTACSSDRLNQVVPSVLQQIEPQADAKM